MKIKRILFAGVLTALIAFSAFAEVKSKKIALSAPITVNGVNLKAGEYRVEVDCEKGELSFLKNGKVVAKAGARVETAPEKSKGTRIETTESDSGELLTAITFSGKDQRIVVANGQGSPSR